MTRIYLAIGALLALLASYAGVYYVGHRAGVDEESARTLTAVTESVAAMQQAMQTVRTESRQQLAEKEAQIRSARRDARETLTHQVKNNEALAACLPVTFATDAIWLR